MENIVMFLRVHKTFLKDTYLFPRLGWVFNVSVIVDKLYFIFLPPESFRRL